MVTIHVHMPTLQVMNELKRLGMEWAKEEAVGQLADLLLDLLHLHGMPLSHALPAVVSSTGAGDMHAAAAVLAATAAKLIAVACLKQCLNVQ